MILLTRNRTSCRANSEVIKFLISNCAGARLIMKLLERLLPEFDSTRWNYYKFQSDAVACLCFSAIARQKWKITLNKA